jgi:hypothetical protein
MRTSFIFGVLRLACQKSVYAAIVITANAATRAAISTFVLGFLIEAMLLLMDFINISFIEFLNMNA